MAAANYFLKIDGIAGESTDKTHKGEIEIESFSWGATQAVSAGTGGGGGAGKVSIADLHFQAATSKASPALFAQCAKGAHIKEATLTCRKSGGSQQDFLVIKMNDVIVSSYQVAGAEETPNDEVGLNFSKISFDVTSGTGPAAHADFDVKLRK